MGVYTKCNNDIVISGIIDPVVYEKFMRQLSIAIRVNKSSDYSDVFTLDNDSFDGKSVLKPTPDTFRGPVSDLVCWLRLVDLLVLRPHCCEIDDQSVSFTEDFDIVVVTFNNTLDEINTTTHRFGDGGSDPDVYEESISTKQWLSVISKFMGKSVTKFEYVIDEDTDESNIVYNDKLTKHSDTNGEIRYDYRPKFDLSKFISSKQVEEIRDICSGGY